MVTTVLELVGSLFVIAGAALFIAPWSAPGALVFVGVSLIGLSALLEMLRRSRR